MSRTQARVAQMISKMLSAPRPPGLVGYAAQRKCQKKVPKEEKWGSVDGCLNMNV